VEKARKEVFGLEKKEKMARKGEKKIVGKKVDLLRHVLFM